MKEVLMQVPFFDLKAQYAEYRAEALKAIDEVCESQMFCLGPGVTKFEEQICDYIGCKYAIGISSGTDALLVSLMSLGVGPGDEVITTPFTFFATAASVARVGAKPVFVDVDEDSYNIDPAGIEEKVTERTRAIIPVHLFGQAAQMGPSLEIAGRYNLTVIEDAAQAMGAMQDGSRCGNFGDAACFSFYPTKNLGAFGDAGLVTTNDERLAGRVRLLRVHGQMPGYVHEAIGGNFRMDNIQAAVLSVKLKHLDNWNDRRREYAGIYDEIFAGSVVRSPGIHSNNVSTYHQYTVTVPDRDGLQKYLKEKGSGCAVFYPRPLHLQDCFSRLGYRAGDFGTAEKLCEEVLSLPIYPELTTGQVEYVGKSVLKFYQ